MEQRNLFCLASKIGILSKVIFFLGTRTGYEKKRLSEMRVFFYGNIKSSGLQKKPPFSLLASYLLLI